MKTAVLLASYNGQNYIKEQLDSLLGQTCQDFVIYVHDDGSTDGTGQILADYTAKYPGRLQLMSGSPTGSAKANFLWMLGQVTADNYLLCDQDDVWASDKVEQELAELSRLPADRPSLVFSDMYVVDEQLKQLSDSFIQYIGRSGHNTAYSQVVIDNPAAGCTMCFNRALRDIAVADHGIEFGKIIMHDAYLLALAAIFGQVSFIDRPLVYYRQTGHNTMGASTETTADKVARNAAEGSAGKQEFINEARRFAGELARIEDLPGDTGRILQEFANIGSRGKLHRIYFYLKHNFTRAHHTWWMLLWV